MTGRYDLCSTIQETDGSPAITGCNQINVTNGTLTDNGNGTYALSVQSALTLPLSIANGGTNNSSAYTAGSVLFSNGTSLTQNNANLFWDNTNNRLGIGTASPASRFHVLATGSTGIARVQDASGFAQLILQPGAVGDVEWALMGGYPAAGDFTIRESGVANYVTVKKTTGNVGIGTTTPGAALHISNGTLPQLIVQSNSAASNVAISFRPVNQGADSSQIQAIEGGTLGSGILTFFTKTGAGSLTEKMRIDTSGNVGVGTATPSSPLEVNGTLRVTRAQGANDLTVVPQAAGEPVYWFNLGATNFWGVRSNGIMQLGPGGMTSNGTVINYSPSANEAQIRRSASLFIDFGSLVGDSELTLQSNTSNVAGRVGMILNQNTALSSTARILEVRGAGTPVFAIDGAGNVGIGTTSPQTILQISSGTPTVTLRNSAGAVDSKNWDWQVVDQNTLDLRVVNDGYTSAVNALQVVRSGVTVSNVTFPNGKVGVGTTSPQSTLDVQGSLRTITTSTSVNLSLTTAHQTILATTGAGGITLTLPAASANTVGLIYHCVKVDAGAGALTIAAAGADTINGAASKTVATQYAAARVVGISATAWAAQSLTAL